MLCATAKEQAQSDDTVGCASCCCWVVLRGPANRRPDRSNQTHTTLHVFLLYPFRLARLANGIRCTPLIARMSCVRFWLCMLFVSYGLHVCFPFPPNTQINLAERRRRNTHILLNNNPNLQTRTSNYFGFSFGDGCCDRSNKFVFYLNFFFEVFVVEKAFARR